MGVRLVILLTLFLVLSLITPIGIADELGSRYLRKGMRGDDVVLLQQNLSASGYQLAIDGIFGAETDNQVRCFQREHGIAIDGIVGPETLAILLLGQANQLEYIVKSGDTLSQIASSYQIELSALITANQLSSTIIYPGQNLVIPRTFEFDDQEYVINNGENLSVIAKKFGLTATDLAAYNGISDPNRIIAGQSIVIPAPAATSAIVTAQARTPQFEWPISGRITSSYGWRDHPVNNYRHFHGGIDIGGVGHGAIIRAAASGRIIESGWMGEYGYGIVIDHGGGYTSWYGHCSQLLVKVGDTVQANQAIARVGSSGVSTGPHLDFRIKYHDETVDPLKYLP